MISHVVAYSNNHVIGKDNQLPWHLPADLRHFKETTLGKTIVMGRKTFESIGRPLPKRKNIVVTRDEDFSVEDVTVEHDLQFLERFIDSTEEVCVIGGGEIFRQTLDATQRLYVTIVDTEIEGDTFYPEIPADFVQVASSFHPKDEQNDHAFEIRQYDRTVD